MTRILGLTHHLGHHHLPKQGLRLWFSQHPEQSVDDCVELGARYGARLSGFQVDRATLDTHLLEEAVKNGCELMRPAKVTSLELHEDGEQVVTLDFQNEQRRIRARWIVDASGRAAMIARKLGHFRPNLEHPINAVWARFNGVKEWDSYEWRERFPDTLIVVAPRVNGPPTICSAAAGGSGSFRCAEGMSVPALCTTAAFSSFRKDRASA